MFSKYITGNHCVSTTCYFLLRYEGCLQIDKIPALPSQHLGTTATTSLVTQTTTLRNQDTFNVAFLQIPAY